MKWRRVLKACPHITYEWAPYVSFTNPTEYWELYSFYKLVVDYSLSTICKQLFIISMYNHISSSKFGLRRVSRLVDSNMPSKYIVFTGARNISGNYLYYITVITLFRRLIRCGRVQNQHVPSCIMGDQEIITDWLLWYDWI